MLLMHKPIATCTNIKELTPFGIFFQIRHPIYFPQHIYILSTHWGQMTHICVSKLTIIGSDNGLSPDRRQAIIWTNTELLLIGPLGTNFSEILIEILTFSFKKMGLKASSAKWRPFCLGLNVLTYTPTFVVLCSVVTTLWLPNDSCDIFTHIHQECCTGTRWAPIQYKDVVLPV